MKRNYCVVDDEEENDVVSKYPVSALIDGSAGAVGRKVTGILRRGDAELHDKRLCDICTRSFCDEEQREQNYECGREVSDRVDQGPRPEQRQSVGGKYNRR